MLVVSFLGVLGVLGVLGALGENIIVRPGIVQPDLNNGGEE